jgi:hypothetical protein
MVSKKIKRNEQHNPLSPPRKERKRKKESNLAPLFKVNGLLYSYKEVGFYKPCNISLFSWQPNTTTSPNENNFDVEYPPNS